MKSYYIPRNYRGEGRILYIFTTKALIYNAVGVGVGLIFYFIFIIFVNATSGVHSLFMALDYIKYNIPILLIINFVYLAILYALIIKIGLNGVILALFLQAVAVVMVKFIIMMKNNYLERH